MVGLIENPDTKYVFLRESGVEVVLADVSIFEPKAEPDISREEVARATVARWKP